MLDDRPRARSISPALRSIIWKRATRSTLAPIASRKDGPIRLLVAAKIGKTRLIDNLGGVATIVVPALRCPYSLRRRDTPCFPFSVHPRIMEGMAAPGALPLRVTPLRSAAPLGAPSRVIRRRAALSGGRVTGPPALTWRLSGDRARRLGLADGSAVSELLAGVIMPAGGVRRRPGAWGVRSSPARGRRILLPSSRRLMKRPRWIGRDQDKRA